MGVNSFVYSRSLCRKAQKKKKKKKKEEAKTKKKKKKKKKKNFDVVGVLIPLKDSMRNIESTLFVFGVHYKYCLYNLWDKKGSCQFLAKECAQYWLTV